MIFAIVCRPLFFFICFNDDNDDDDDEDDVILFLLRRSFIIKNFKPYDRSLIMSTRRHKNVYKKKQLRLE